MTIKIGIAVVAASCCFAISAMAQSTTTAPAAERAPGSDEPYDVVVTPPKTDGVFVGRHRKTPTFGFVYMPKHERDGSVKD